MKHQVDKKRSERSIVVGDQVFIKLQPYVQSSVACRACHKLSFNFFGPFAITEHIGQVAYRVALPETSTIHPVFHVSLLRKALKATDQVIPVLPTDTNQYVIPVQVLDKRRKTTANMVIDQGFIRWSSGTLPDSWENLDDLQTHFPCAAAWGQAATESSGPAAHCQPSTRPCSNRQCQPSSRVSGPEWQR